MPNSPNPTQNFGKFMIFGAWILILMLFALFFHQWEKKNTAPKTPLVREVTGEKQTVISRNEANQYLVEGQINGVEVVFLLDTGATEVVVPLGLAKKLNLIKGPKVTATTAGGKVEVYVTKIKELVIGHIVLHDLRANINPHMDEKEEILLGMSALRKLRFWQEEGNLILEQK